MGRAFRRSFLLVLCGAIIPACGGGSGGGGGGLPPGFLSGLTISSGSLNPTFDPQTWTYMVGPGLVDSTITVTATGVDPGSTITVNGSPVTSGVPSVPIAINPGANVVTIEVTPPVKS